jgi:hypothetical protein
VVNEVRNNPDASRYELYVDGTLTGIADYALRDGTYVFPHTEIDPPMRGQGLANVLVRAALDDVRSHGGRIVARCWFVREFVDRHPEYADLLAA